MALTSAVWSDEQLQQFVVPGTFTIQDVRDMKKAFDLLDDDNSEVLEVEEFLAAVKALNVKLDLKSDISVDQAIRNTLAGAGEMTFEEFMKRMTARLEQSDTCDDVLGIFEMFDQESTGCISVENLMAVARQCEPDIVSQSDIDTMLRNIDCTGCNEIDPVDFYMALMRGVESREERERQVVNELEAQSRTGSPMMAKQASGILSMTKQGSGVLTA